MAAHGHGKGPVFKFFEGCVAPYRVATKPGATSTATVSKHDHKFRAVAKGTDANGKYLVLSACALCSATKVDDLNPEDKARLALRRERIESYRTPRGGKS